MFWSNASSVRVQVRPFGRWNSGQTDDGALVSQRSKCRGEDLLEEHRSRSAVPVPLQVWMLGYRLCRTRMLMWASRLSLCGLAEPAVYEVEPAGGGRDDVQAETRGADHRGCQTSSYRAGAVTSSRGPQSDGAKGPGAVQHEGRWPVWNGGMPVLVHPNRYAPSGQGPS
jgi:hypothetical protein